MRQLGRALRPATIVLVVAIITVALVGCARQAAGPAHAEPQAHAFPDLSKFTAVQADTYYVPLHGGPTYRFVTQAAIRCEINLAGPWCAGRFSADPAGPNDVCSTVGPPNSGGGAAYTIQRDDDECGPSTHDDHVLDPEKKLVADWGPQVRVFTCAVGPRTRVACTDKDHNHGFVIESTGTWTF